MEYLLIPLLVLIWVIIWGAASFHEKIKYHLYYLTFSQMLEYHDYHFTWDYSHTHFADLVIKGKRGKKIYINNIRKTCTPVPLDEV